VDSSGRFFFGWRQCSEFPEAVGFGTGWEIRLQKVVPVIPKSSPFEAQHEPY